MDSVSGLGGEPEEQARDYSDEAPTPSRGRGAGAVALVLLGAFGLFALFVLVRNDWQTSDPGSMVARAFDFAAGERVEGLDATSVEALAVDREGSGRVLMVMGQVFNASMGTKRRLRVEARVLDSGGEVIARREAACGHIFSAEELRSMTDAEIGARYQALDSEERLVRPGSSLACAVVFEQVPASYSAATGRVELVVTSAEPVVERGP